MSTGKYQIRATSNILNLLGDELIGNDSLAIFELVKNSYDADAEEVTISFIDLNTPQQRIIVEDDGCGMTPEIIKKAWLTIGTNYKKKEAKISKKYHRFSLGNKGVGRLAVHKLADSIILETQTSDDLFGTLLEINWKELIASGDYIENLFVEVKGGLNQPLAKGHGTRITLTGLKTKHWTKTQLRDLVRKIDNFKNPLQPIDNFKVNIICDEDKQNWISDIKFGTDILQDSLYCFKFSLSPNNADFSSEDHSFAKFEWEYSFRPHLFHNLSDNLIKSSENEILLPVNPKIFIDNQTNKGKYYLQNNDLAGIGTITGQFHVFNQSKPILDVVYGVGRNSSIKII